MLKLEINFSQVDLITLPVGKSHTYWLFILVGLWQPWTKGSKGGLLEKPFWMCEISILCWTKSYTIRL